MHGNIGDICSLYGYYWSSSERSMYSAATVGFLLSGGGGIGQVNKPPHLQQTVRFGLFKIVENFTVPKEVLYG